MRICNGHYELLYKGIYQFSKTIHIHEIPNNWIVLGWRDDENYTDSSHCFELMPLLGWVDLSCNCFSSVDILCSYLWIGQLHFYVIFFHMKWTPITSHDLFSLSEKTSSGSSEINDQLEWNLFIFLECLIYIIRLIIK